jgi:predicted small integral membrane protein
MDELAATEPQTFHCARHHSVETLLRCGRCETPICPRCMIGTPVGMRCRDCAQVHRPPMYDLRGRYLWQALGAAVALVIAGGFAFSLLSGFAGRSIFLAAILYLLAGVAIAEALSAAANRKRGPRLQILAAVTTVLATQFPTLLTLAVAHRLPLNPLGLLLTAVAAAIAWSRLR